MRLAIAGSLLLVAAPALSQDYARPGFYVGADMVGGSYTEIEDELEDAVPVGIDVDTAIGFDAYAGYRLHPNVALEAEFELLPETDIEASGFGTFAEIETWTLTGNAVVYVLTGRIQPFALIGLGVMQAEVEDTVGLGVDEDEAGFAVRFGGGVDIYVTENVAVSVGVDYVLPGDDDLEDTDYVSYGGGAMLRF
jgi:opacity protein-like surface antigen